MIFMKIITGLFLLTLIAFFSCNKDKFKTEPQVTVKSISPSEVRQGTNGSFTVITLDAKFTDNEGDIDTVLVITKFYDGDAVTLVDTMAPHFPIDVLKLPPKTREGDMSVQFEYNTNNSNGQYFGYPGVAKDTTATLGLVLIDAAGHRSNYSESSKIRLIAN